MSSSSHDSDDTSDYCVNMSNEALAYLRLFLASFNTACSQQKESFDVLQAQQREILDKVVVLTERVASIEANTDTRFASVAS